MELSTENNSAEYSKFTINILQWCNQNATTMTKQLLTLNMQIEK